MAPEEAAAMAERRLTRAWQQLHRRLAEVPSDISDAQLLERFVAQRDEAAFELLVWRHSRLVLGVCRRILKNHHDAEDAFQAAFLALARKAASINQRESISAWLHQVAWRIALRLSRTIEKRTLLSLPTAVLSATAAIGPDASPECQDLRTVLDQEVDRLPERYRRPIIICYLEGASYADAGRALDCSRGTVATRLARAREMLRKRLLRRGVTLTVAGLAALKVGETVSAALIEPTVKGALLFAMGQAAAGVVPARAVVLAKGAIRTMFMSRFKIVTAIVLAIVVAVGGGVAVWQTWASDGKSDAAEGGPDPGKGLPIREGAQTVRPPQDNTAGTWTPGQKFSWNQDIRSGFFSSDGRRMACVTHQGLMVIWDVATGKEKWRPKPEDGVIVSVMAFSPDGKLLVTGGGMDMKGKSLTAFQLWDPNQAQLISQGQDPAAELLSLAFTADGKSVVASFFDKKVTCLDLNLKPLWNVDLPSQANIVVCSPDNRHIAAVGLENASKPDPGPGTVHLLDAATGKVIAELKGHAQQVASAAFSPDGKLLATASHDKTVRLWDMATRQEVRQLKGHSDYVTSVVFSGDGKWIATGGGDNLARVWDVATGQQIAFLSHENPVWVLGFAPGGKLATLCDKVIQIWHFMSKDSQVPQPARESTSKDRLTQLVQDLLEKQKTDEQVLEALFLATLARLPSEIEKTLTLGQLTRYKDRREGFTSVLNQLISTREYRDHIEALRAEKPPQ